MLKSDSLRSLHFFLSLLELSELDVEPAMHCISCLISMFSTRLLSLISLQPAQLAGSTQAKSNLSPQLLSQLFSQKLDALFKALGAVQLGFLSCLMLFRL